MQSLRQLAIGRIPVVEIWQQGLLEEGGPLPSKTVEELKSRLTLENLFREGSLTSNLDLDLFAYILRQQGLLKLLYPYLFDLGVIYTDEFSFYDANDENYEPLDLLDANTAIYYLPGEEIIISIQDKLQPALQRLLDDLVSFLENPGLPIANIYTLPMMDYGGLHEDESGGVIEEKVEFTFIWDRYNDMYRLFVIEEVDKNNNKLTLLTTFQTIDNLLKDVISYEDRFITRLFTIILQPNILEPNIRCALQCFHNTTSTDLWKELKTKTIKLTGDLQMVPDDLVGAKEIRRIDDYLYIQGKTQVPYYLNNDGILILDALSINPERWYTVDITTLLEEGSDDE